MKAGWQAKTIGEVCEVMNGGTPKTGVKDFWDGDHQWITPAEMGKRASPYVAETERQITDKGLGNSSARLMPPKSVILSSRAPIGHLVINIEPMAFNQGCKGLIPKDSLHYKYLYYYLFGKVDLLNSLGTGATFKELSGGKLKEVPIPIAPLPEQQRIVTILDQAFEGIATATANAEKNLANAREIFDDYLNVIVASHGEGWKKTKLCEIAEYFNGLTYSPKDVADKGIIVLRSSNVQNDELDFSDVVRVNLSVKDKIKVKDGDILMCSRNGSKRLVGKTATIKNLNEEMTFGTFMMIIRSPFNHYLSWFFKSKYFRAQIAGGENTMINQITRYMLDDVNLNLPPIQLQSELAYKLDELFAETKRLEGIYQQKLLALDELKKSILHQAFTGQLN